MHPVGTVPTNKMHPVGTVPTDKMHPVGTLKFNQGWEKWPFQSKLEENKNFEKKIQVKFFFQGGNIWSPSLSDDAHKIFPKNRHFFLFLSVCPYGPWTIFMFPMHTWLLCLLHNSHRPMYYVLLRKYYRKNLREQFTFVLLPGVCPNEKVLSIGQSLCFSLLFDKIS